MGAPLVAHWGFPDPPDADDPEAAFELVYRGLTGAIERFVGTGGDLRARARTVADHVDRWRLGSVETP